MYRWRAAWADCHLISGRFSPPGYFDKRAGRYRFRHVISLHAAACIDDTAMSSRISRIGGFEARASLFIEISSAGAFTIGKYFRNSRRDAKALIS